MGGNHFRIGHFKECTVDPWHPQVDGLKETSAEEKPHAQDVESSVLFCRCLIRFPHSATQLPIKTAPFSKPQISLYHSLFSYFWSPFTFREADFHKMKSRETLSRSHNDLNTTDLSSLFQPTDLGQN
jgi:hypothetical protein